ncbi:MAG: hypothetical protein Kow0080_37340 [Candidatus Promineifilaceae bacterium]
MNEKFEAKIIDCLDALERGDSVETILARYPQDAHALRPILETAVSLTQLNVQPMLSAQAKSRDRFLAEAAALRQRKPRAISFWIRLQQAMAPVTALAAILIFLGVGLISASSTAVPGDALYTTKRVVEEIRQALTLETAARLDLIEALKEERLSEIRTLLLSGRIEAVTFEGTVEEMGEQTWLISRLPVAVTPETTFNGMPRTGSVVHVDGVTTPNGLVAANTITVLDGSEVPEVTATPTPTNTAVPAETPTHTPSTTPTPTTTGTHTPSPTPSPTTTGTHTPTPTPTNTAVPTNTPLPPTATVQPPPPPPATATPTPSDNGNDNDDDDDDNHNDNGDNDNDNKNKNG